MSEAREVLLRGILQPTILFLIKKAEALKPRPSTAEKLPVDTISPAGSAEQTPTPPTRFFFFPRYLTLLMIMGLPPQGEGLLAITPANTLHASLHPFFSFITGHSGSQEYTLRRCYQPLPLRSGSAIHLNQHVITAR